MNPDAAARLLAAERARITSEIDKRISSWEQFYIDYPEVEGTLMTISELDWLKGVVNAHQEPQADNPGHLQR